MVGMNDTPRGTPLHNPVKGWPTGLYSQRKASLQPCDTILPEATLKQANDCHNQHIGKHAERVKGSEMKNSKLFLLAAPFALAGGALVATPAAAAPAQSAHQLQNQITQLDRQVEQAESRGNLSRSEARSLLRDVSGLQNLYRSYSRGGFDRRELNTLGERVDDAQKALAKATRDQHHDHRR